MQNRAHSACDKYGNQIRGVRQCDCYQQLSESLHGLWYPQAQRPVFLLVFRRERRPHGDAVVSVGSAAVRQDKAVKITQALNDFAIEFRQMSSDEVRKRRNIATNPHAAEFNRSLDLAISAGLL
jgi:hypothetical protein